MRACLKAKLLTGTYNLQARRANFKTEDSDSKCKLCDEAPENREHFIVSCKALSEVREPYMSNIFKAVANAIGHRKANIICNTPDAIVRTILDPSHHTMQKKHIDTIEKLTRQYLFAIHIHRTTELSQPRTPSTQVTGRQDVCADRHPMAYGVRLIKTEHHRLR